MYRPRRWPLGALLAILACGGDDGTSPRAEGDVALTLVVENLARLDSAREGTFEAWVRDPGGSLRSAGRFQVSGPGRETIRLTSPVADPTEVIITVEPPGDADAEPSLHELIGGTFDGGTAELGTNSHLTPGVDFVEAPGTHVLFTPSDNAEVGYPSNEDSGIWLFEFGGEAEDASFWLNFTPADRGWIYEGWMVMDYGTPSEVWFSYGKFNADSDSKASSRDDTGLGPFSGQLDYRTAMPEEIVMPGDDWVSNPGGYPVPGNVPLPLDLNGCLSEACQSEFFRGPSRFTHVITMEPTFDVGEDPWAARPFFVRPYRNPVGEGSPATKRVIEFHPEDLPRGTARLGG